MCIVVIGQFIFELADDNKKDISNESEVVKPKIKHDWYQTESHVIIVILAKNVQEINVNFKQENLSLTAKLSDGTDYSLEFHLAHHVVPEQCSYNKFPSKVEIKLKKQDGYRWQSLEGPMNHEKSLVPHEDQPPKYPTSCKKAKDWDKVEKEVEKEVSEEPEDASALFQKIFSQGTDETRRAMNKSFQESGGTVLSTNWNEVSKKTVERQT